MLKFSEEIFYVKNKCSQINRAYELLVSLVRLDESDAELNQQLLALKKIKGKTK